MPMKHSDVYIVKHTANGRGYDVAYLNRDDAIKLANESNKGFKNKLYNAINHGSWIVKSLRVL